MAWRGHGGGQPGEQDVEAAFEFGGAVVGGQDGGQAAEQGEVADGQPVQAEPEQVVGLVGVDGEWDSLATLSYIDASAAPAGLGSTTAVAGNDMVSIPPAVALKVQCRRA